MACPPGTVQVFSDPATGSEGGCVPFTLSDFQTSAGLGNFFKKILKPVVGAIPIVGGCRRGSFFRRRPRLCGAPSFSAERAVWWMPRAVQRPRS